VRAAGGAWGCGCPPPRLRPQPQAHARPLREPATKPNTPMPITGSAMPPHLPPHLPPFLHTRDDPRPSASLAPTREAGDVGGEPRARPREADGDNQADGGFYAHAPRCLRQAVRPPTRAHTHARPAPSRHRHRPTGCPPDATGCPTMAGRPSKAIPTPLYHYRPGDGESGLAGAHAPAHAPTPAQTHTRRQARARKKKPPVDRSLRGARKPLVRSAP
jgi:hypothetical protein